jgi:WS/DGAT/MGAT family acyltransferase
MERMGSLDAVFIAVEDTVNHMHIGSVGIFEGPVPSFEAVRALCAAKLQFVARYRQRVREAPASIGRPLWIDDVDFDLENHLRHTALPTGDRFGLEQLVGRVMSHPLDRRHPLWEMWLIEGLGDDRWALLSKVHHCMVDGIAGSDLLAVIMDLEPDAPLPAPDDWTPAAEPSRIELARDTGEMTIKSISDAVRGGARALRHPVGAFDRARIVATGAARIAAPARRGGSSLTGPIGPRRRWARTSVPLDDVKTIRVAFGGTVNDVVLTAVTRGFRQLLHARGERVDGRTITTLVPVSMRSADARGTLDNRVSAVYARLPIGVDDPVDALGAVREHMDELKSSGEVDASGAIVGVGDFAPPVLAAVLARALVHGQEIVQTVATNVPGPQVPLYVCGRRMLEAYPYVPIAGHIRIGVAIWSYCGELFVGITGDWHGARDIDRLARGIDLAFEELLKEATSAGS